MEATGVYHERVCHYLHDAGHKVVVLLSNHVKAYARSLGANSKNDKVDAQVMAQMGLERSHQAWVKPAGNIVKIKHLARERQGIIDERTVSKNQQAAAIAAHSYDRATEKRFNARIKFLDAQIKEIETELATNVAQDEALRNQVKRITTIPGFGVLSATLVLAETNAFADFQSKAQLTSYAGYDVVQNQSGTFNGKTRISKKGNSRLRLALYFPSISAIRHCPPMKDLYERIFDRTKIKMKGVVAVQRKMLLLAYTLCKTETDFDPEFHPKNAMNNIKVTENLPPKGEIEAPPPPVNKKVDTTLKRGVYAA
jgi:transposase